MLHKWQLCVILCATFLLNDLAASHSDLDRLPEALPFAARGVSAASTKPRCIQHLAHLEQVSACDEMHREAFTNGTFFHTSNGRVVALIQREAFFAHNRIGRHRVPCRPIEPATHDTRVAADRRVLQSSQQPPIAPQAVGVALDPLGSASAAAPRTAQYDSLEALLVASEILRAAWSIGASHPNAGGVPAVPVFVRDAPWAAGVRYLRSRSDVDAWLRAMAAPSPSTAMAGIHVPHACAAASDAAPLEAALALLSPGAARNVTSPCVIQHAAEDTLQTCDAPQCVTASLAHLAPSRLPLLQAAAAEAGTRPRCAQPSLAWEQLSRHVRRVRGLAHSVPKAIAEWPVHKPGFPVGDQLSLLFHVPGLQHAAPEELEARVNALMGMAQYRKTSTLIAVVDLNKLLPDKTAEVVAATDILVSWGHLPLQHLLALPEWGGVFQMHDDKPSHDDGLVRITAGLLRRVVAVFGPAVRQPGKGGTTGTLRTAKLQSGFGDVVQLVQQRRRDMPRGILSAEVEVRPQ